MWGQPPGQARQLRGLFPSRSTGHPVLKSSGRGRCCSAENYSGAREASGLDAWLFSIGSVAFDGSSSSRHLASLSLKNFQVCCEPSIPFRPPGRHNPTTLRTMQLPLLSCGLWGLLAATQAAATALTYKINANEEACFYTATQKANEKIAFYFAVCLPITAG